MQSSILRIREELVDGLEKQFFRVYLLRPMFTIG